RTLSEEDLLAVPPPQGVERLRHAIAADLRAYRGMAAEAEQIVVGAGAEYLYILLAQLLGPCAVIALEDPGYPKIRLVYQKCGAKCVSVPMDRQGVRMEALARSGATAAHISPAHHYPTGVVTPIGRRHALLRWAADGQGGNRWIIEDDYDSEFRSAGRPLPAMGSIDTAGRVVYMNTFSQTISPALRIGYMVLPPRLVETYRRELGFYACTVPALEQHVLARFLEEGTYQRHLSRMRKEYRTRRAAALDAFRRCPFADRIQIVEQGAGLHFLLRLDTREPDETLLRRGEELGVRLRFLSQFAAVPREDFAHTLVVNYAPLPPDRLPEAMRLLEQVLFPRGEG
ncbi:MAG: PLP-dependent aminotransferase family protein, partial [Oscillibacter sp.]|nr:PLP-dependent aminotransferase family protein [Oscillibacter sp.]